MAVPGGEAQPNHLPWMDPQAVEQDEALECLHYVDDIIVWKDTAEVFETGKKIV